MFGFRPWTLVRQHLVVFLHNGTIEQSVPLVIACEVMVEHILGGWYGMGDRVAIN